MSLSSISFGQTRVKRILESFLKNNKIPLTFIFSGPQGSGKSFFAKHFTEDLVCPSKEDIFACKKCISCKLIEVGTSPDFLKFESDKTGSIKLEDMYNLKEFVSFKPVYGLKKVALIEDAHLLTIEAFNSILKTLEEPNMSTVIILTTSKIDFIPKTIKSRTVIIPFSSYTEEEIINILINEKINLETSQYIAKISKGNIKNALDMTKESSLEERATLINYLFDLIMEEPKKILITDKSIALKLIIFWQSILRDSLIIRLTRNRENIVNLDFKEKIDTLASMIDLHNLFKIEDILITSEEELTQININIKSYMSSLFYSIKEIVLGNIALQEEY